MCNLSPAPLWLDSFAWCFCAHALASAGLLPRPSSAVEAGSASCRMLHVGVKYRILLCVAWCLVEKGGLGQRRACHKVSSCRMPSNNRADNRQPASLVTPLSHSVITFLHLLAHLSVLTACLQHVPKRPKRLASASASASLLSQTRPCQHTAHPSTLTEVVLQPHLSSVATCYGLHYACWRSQDPAVQKQLLAWAAGALSNQCLFVSRCPQRWGSACCCPPKFLFGSTHDYCGPPAACHRFLQAQKVTNFNDQPGFSAWGVSPASSRGYGRPPHALALHLHTHTPLLSSLVICTPRRSRLSSFSPSALAHSTPHRQAR